MMRSALLLAILMASPALPQEVDRKKPGKDRSEVTPERVDKAIENGIRYLLAAKSFSSEGTGWAISFTNSHELLLLTFLHSEIVPVSHPRFQELLKEMLAAPIDFVYKAALQAMVLEELDRVQFQKRIWECAYFLVNTQFPDGRWDYGEKLEIPAPPPGQKIDVATGGKAPPAKKDKLGKRVKPPVRQKLPVAKVRDGTVAIWLNSSTGQYAALGLRACWDAGIVIPEQTIRRGIQWWHDNQCPEVEGDKSKPVATGRLPGPGRGWGYQPGQPATHSMTAGAVGSLAIYNYMLGSDWTRDKAAVAGVNFLADRFTVRENPGYDAIWGPTKEFFLYYYLYALERVGILCNLQRLGNHDWYTEGAKTILDAQKPEGSWKVSTMDTKLLQSEVLDTCFAILFLKRATRPLVPVPSVDPFWKK